ncbi:MAG: aldo/keto reductase [Caldilineaceae bacterium]
MDQIQFGDTGATVSPLCLGTDNFGSRIAPDIAFQLLDQFHEAGGNFIDTANIYAMWIPGFQGVKVNRRWAIG